ncbi:HVA22-like protein a [Linum perenne]
MANGSGNFIQVVAKNFDVLALPLVTLLYPLYASIRAIETKSRSDDQQWLTYWVLYSMITLFELTFAKILEWHSSVAVRKADTELLASVASFQWCSSCLQTLH